MTSGAPVRPPLPANRPTLATYRPPLPPPLDVIDHLAIFLASHGPTVINLFFTPPNKGHYDALSKMRDFELLSANLNQFDTLAVGKLFKDLLSKEKPLFGYENYDALIDIQRQSPDAASKVQSLSLLCHHRLDTAHRSVINDVMKMFALLESNKILTQLTIDKLAYSFGPSLIRPLKESNDLATMAQNTKHANELIKLFIKKRDEILVHPPPAQSHSHVSLTPPVTSGLSAPKPSFPSSNSHPSLASMALPLQQAPVAPSAVPVFAPAPMALFMGISDSTPPPPPPPAPAFQSQSPVMASDSAPPPPPILSSAPRSPPPSSPPVRPASVSAPPPPPLMKQNPPPPLSMSATAPAPPPVSSYNTPPPPAPVPGPAPPAASRAPAAPATGSRASTSGGAGGGRDALLGAIQGFGKGGLRKAQTVDKSAPVIDGRESRSSSESAAPASTASSSSQSSFAAARASISGGGGLFAGGFPTLRKSSAGDASHSRQGSATLPPSFISSSTPPPPLAARSPAVQSAAMPPPPPSMSNSSPKLSAAAAAPPPPAFTSSYNLPPPPPPAGVSSSPPLRAFMSAASSPPLISSNAAPPPPPAMHNGPPPPAPVMNAVAPPPPPFASSAAPPPPSAPSAPVFTIQPKRTSTAAVRSGGDGGGRDALLGAIQGFGKGGLRKTQTVDKSAPIIEGNAPPASESSAAPPSQSHASAPPPPVGRSSMPAMSMQEEMAARMAKMRASRGS